LNPILIRSTEKLTGICLTNLESDPFAKLEQDPLLLCDVLWCLCEDEAKTRDITVEEFYEALDGDTLERAAQAIEEAICFFYPPAKRSSLRGMLEKNRGLRQAAMDQAMEKLASPETEKRILTAHSQEAERANTQAQERSSSGH
jgi:hypothetical protein